MSNESRIQEYDITGRHPDAKLYLDLLYQNESNELKLDQIELAFNAGMIQMIGKMQQIATALSEEQAAAQLEQENIALKERLTFLQRKMLNLIHEKKKENNPTPPDILPN